MQKPVFKEIRYLPGHILRIKKLLQTRLPLHDYQEWLKQDPAVMLQDLMDIDFDLSLITWQQIIASQPGIVDLILADDMLTKQVRRKVLFYLCDVQQIDLALDNMLIQFFSLDRNQRKENRVMPLIYALDLSYLLALPSAKRCNFLKLMQARVCTSEVAINALSKWAKDVKIWYDFTGDEMLLLKLSSHWTSFSFPIIIHSHCVNDEEFYMTLSGGGSLSNQIRHFSDYKDIPSNSICKVIPYHSALAVSLLTRCPNIAEQEYSLFMATTRRNIKFAVALMQALHSTWSFPCIPQDHLIRNIAVKNVDEIIKYIPKKIDNLNDVDETTFWQIIRVIAIGLSQKNPELLYDIAKIFSVEDYFTMRYVNVLLSISFNSGFAKAGIQLADHFWRGIGTCPSRKLAIEIYKTIATNKPELLTLEAIDRLASECLLSAYTLREECDVLIRQMTTMLYVIPEKKMKQNVVKEITDAFGSEYSTFFSDNKIKPNETLEALRKDIFTKTKLIIAELNYVVKLDLSARPELRNHVGCMSAHVMLLQVVNHLMMVMPECKQWIPLRAASLKALSHLDGLQDADEEFVRYLRGIKQAPEKEANAASVKLFDRKIDRSQSVPNLPKSEFIIKATK